MPAAAPLPNASATKRGAVSTGAQAFAGVKTFEDPPDVTAGTTNSHYVDAGAYGMSPDNTGAQNRAALQAAIAAAQAAGKEVRIPIGRFLMNMHALGSPNACINITGGVVVRAAGKSVTTLKADGFVEGQYSNHGSPDWQVDVANDNGAALFRVAPGAGAVTFSDMTLEGPDADEITFDGNVCWAMWSGGGNQIAWERIDTLRWSQVSKCSPEYPTYPGVGTNFKATDCHIGYRSNSGPLHIAGTDALQDSADFVRCTFECDDEGSPTQAQQPVSNGQYPCFYINRGVSLSTDGCRFIKAGRGIDASAASDGWLHYGGGYFPGQNSDAMYARSVNDVFGPDIQVQMYASATCETQVIGSTFNTGAGNVGIDVAGPMALTNVQFLPEDGAGYGVTASAPAALRAANCIIGRDGQGDGYSLAINRAISDPNPWRFIHCDFNDVAAGQFQQSTDGDTVTFFDVCSFQGGHGVYSVTVLAGQVVVSDCLMKNLPMYADGSGHADGSTLEMNRNKWFVSARTQLQAPTGNPVAIRGVDNQPYEFGGIAEGIAIVSATGVTNISGSLVNRRGVGGYSYSGGTLTLSLGHDCAEVDEPGTPTVNDMTFSGGMASGVTIDHLNQLHHGRVFIRAKQALAFGSSGNIVAAAGTRPAGSVTPFQWFPSAAKWYEA